MNEIEYRNNPAVNKSTLWEMRKSPLHYWHLMHDTPKEDTKAMQFGRAVHSRLLQPASFDAEYAVAPECDRRTKEGKAIWNELLASGKEVISQADMDIINAMQAEYIRTIYYSGDKDWWKIIDSEVPLFWTDDETGIECKARLDLLAQDYVIDYKTTMDASTNAFHREALRYGYDLQAAMYMEAARANGYNPKGFIFIAQEKNAPYMINILYASDAFLDRGRWIMRDLLAQYKECRDSNNWPGYGVNQLILNEWEVMGDE
ncbi:MAG: PD-(D/E)XK nuclease-like domain-containing protein [Oscillospiraceae bacterium]|nr:PD-(D/E)XK nuclease-like domain-containing protein [Oscillospiraceae bacterium]